MKKNRRLFYATQSAITHDWFAVKTTAGGNKINFWHDSGEHVYFYTFKANDRYNKSVIWSDKLCHSLLSELHEDPSSFEILRLAVDDVYSVISSDSANSMVPRMPEKIDGWNSKLLKSEAKLEELSRIAPYEEQKGSETAPFVLFGKHKKLNKEYAWKLTPDTEKRQNIAVGDTVMVWTRYGYATVVVTRIEKSEDVFFEPVYRVKKKVVGLV